MVSREDVAESPKIAGLHLPGAEAADIHAVGARDRLGARIRRTADMPVTRSGGIDPQIKPGRRGTGAERAFGQRRPADVAQTDEQDRRRLHVHARP